jgi:hypothetical protein
MTKEATVLACSIMEMIMVMSKSLPKLTGRDIFDALKEVQDAAISGMTDSLKKKV